MRKDSKKEYEDEDLYVSRSQKKRDSTHLQKLGEQLAKLSKAKIQKMNLSEDLQHALFEYNNLKKFEAKRRHLQYVGKLMRSEDNIEEIEEILNELNK